MDKINVVVSDRTRTNGHYLFEDHIAFRKLDPNAVYVMSFRYTRPRAQEPERPNHESVVK